MSVMRWLSIEPLAQLVKYFTQLAGIAFGHALCLFGALFIFVARDFLRFTIIRHPQ